jgi:hypothetical protein
MRLQAGHRNRGSSTVTSPNSVAMQWPRQSFHILAQHRQHGRRRPWRPTCPETIAHWTLARSCFASGKVKPRFAISPKSFGRQISTRSVLRQRSSSPVAINRNTHRIRAPQAIVPLVAPSRHSLDTPRTTITRRCNGAHPPSQEGARLAPAAQAALTCGRRDRQSGYTVAGMVLGTDGPTAYDAAASHAHPFCWNFTVRPVRRLL